MLDIVRKNDVRRIEMDEGSLIKTLLFSRRDCPLILALFASRPEYFAPAALPLVDRCLEVGSGYRIFLVRERERIIGCAIWHEGLYEAEINWLVVAADKERQGIGRILVERVVASAQQGGLRYLRLVTAAVGSDDDPRDAAYRGTHKFYKKFGFGQIAILPAYWPSGEDAALFMKRI
jgi:GNAT superfamily N-acetyltransferase